MIVISTALVLGAAEAAVNLTHPLIGYDNLVTTGNITASTEAEGFPVTNLANPATHLKWRAVVDSPIADEYLTIETNRIDPIDYVAVARHNWGSGNIPVSIEYLDVGQSPPVWEELVQEVMLADDGPVLFRFLPQSISILRIRMQPGDAPAEAAVVYCGALLVTERGMTVETPHVPLDFGVEERVVDGMSESGEFLGRVVLGSHSESTADFRYFTPAWYRVYFNQFVIAAREIPFFFAWNPSEYPFEVGYAWLMTSPKPVVDPHTMRMHVVLAMRGIN